MQGSSEQKWTVKIGNADDSTQDGSKFTVYVVEVTADHASTIRITLRPFGHPIGPSSHWEMHAMALCRCKNDSKLVVD